MASYTFKNMLIVDRSSTNMKTVRLLKERYGLWFPEHQPFEYLNEKDKIIVFYYYNIGTHRLSKLSTEVFIPGGEEIQGIVKILSDNLNLRIINAQFRNYEDCYAFLGNLREYLIKTISGNTDRYVIHWDPVILHNSPCLEYCAKEARLLSDTVNKTYTFYGTGVPSTKHEQKKPSFSFGASFQKTTKQPAFSFGASSQKTTKQPAFSFGASSQETTKQPTFSFGASSQ